MPSGGICVNTALRSNRTSIFDTVLIASDADIGPRVDLIVPLALHESSSLLLRARHSPPHHTSPLLREIYKFALHMIRDA